MRAEGRPVRDEDITAVFIPKAARDDAKYLRRYSSRCLADADMASTTGRWVCVRLKGHEGRHG